MNALDESLAEAKELAVRMLARSDRVYLEMELSKFAARCHDRQFHELTEFFEDALLRNKA